MKKSGNYLSENDICPQSEDSVDNIYATPKRKVPKISGDPDSLFVYNTPGGYGLHARYTNASADSGFEQSPQEFSPSAIK